MNISLNQTINGSLSNVFAFQINVLTTRTDEGGFLKFDYI